MEPYVTSYLKENDLIREMMKQGEFSCLVDLSDGKVFRKDRQFIIQWWCRKTDQMYESAAPTLMEALCSVLGQAHADPDPWVTEEQLKESEEKYKIQIFIPCVPSSYKPVHKDPDYADADFISRCLVKEPKVAPVLTELAGRASAADNYLDKIEDTKGHDRYDLLANKLQCYGWCKVTFKEDEDYRCKPHENMWIKPNRNPIVAILDCNHKLVRVKQITRFNIRFYDA